MKESIWKIYCRTDLKPEYRFDLALDQIASIGLRSGGDTFIVTKNGVLANWETGNCRLSELLLDGGEGIIYRGLAYTARQKAIKIAREKEHNLYDSLVQKLNAELLDSQVSREG